MTPTTIRRLCLRLARADGLSGRGALAAGTRRLAEICGVSVRTVEDWLQGRSRPSGPAQRLIRQVRGP